MLQQKHKVLIILWKWRFLKDPLSNIHEIEGDNACKIICINEKQSQEVIKAEIDKKAKKWLEKSADIMVMLHSNTTEYKLYDEIGKSLFLNNSRNSKPIVYTFGGGKKYIYYNPVTDTGILDEEGSFNNRPNKWKDPDTGESKSEKRSVLAEKSGKLLKNYFDSVWDYYFYQIKRNTFNLLERLSIYLVGSRIFQENAAPDSTLYDFLEKNDFSLFKDVEAFCKEGINPAYDELVRFFNEKMTQENYLNTMRKKFAALLETMPGLAYES